MATRLVHVLHETDNVATALVDLELGTTIELDRPGPPARRPAQSVQTVTLRRAIPFGHKVALAAIVAGRPVIKYGEVIGLATADIAPGEHVHVHNVESQRGRGDLARGAAI